MSNQPLIAITGASGLLGRPLYRQLAENPRYRVRGAAFSRAGSALDRLDLTSPGAAEAWLDETQPAALVHLAAERRPDAYTENPAAADRLNISATRDLAEKCRERRIPFLFLSTNYVFDGTAAPYSPGDMPNPLNDYGRSKRAGEEAVVAGGAGNYVLRIPMLFGPSDNLEESSVTQVALALLKSEGPVPLDIRQKRYPAYTPDLAAAIVGLLPGLIDRTLPGPYLHYCSGPEASLTKRDIGEILAPLVGVNPSRAAADERPPSGAPRPENVRLLCPTLESLGLLKMTPFRDAIAQTMGELSSAGGLS